MKLVWTVPARQDLRKIFAFIADENPAAAKRLLTEIKERPLFLQENPQMGRIGRVDGTKEFVVSGTQYILAYRVVYQQIQVLVVFHSAREWPDSF